MAARKKKKKKYRMFWFFAKMQLVLLLAVIAGACWYYFGGYAEEVKDLKTQAIELVRHSSKETFKANQTSIVYASDESVISTLKGGKDSYYLSITDMPSNVECAIVSIEDKKFFRHNGIDYRALLRAVKAMIENGEATQGSSVPFQFFDYSGLNYHAFKLSLHHFSCRLSFHLIVLICIHA